MYVAIRYLFKFSLAIALALTTVPAYSATIAGSSCAKVGNTKTISNIKYTCIKSGKKLIWNKGVKQPVPTSASDQAKLGARMAMIASVQMLADNLWKNSQGLKVEDPTAMTIKSSTIATKISEAKAARQMIMSFSPMFPNFDMNDLPVENFAPAHGVFHLAQNFMAATGGGVDANLIPGWFREGSAAMYSTMVASQLSNKNPNYGTLVAKNSSNWKNTDCKSEYARWKSDNKPATNTTDCEIALGQVLSEAIINRTDSLDKVLLIYQMVAIGNTFDEAFNYALGIRKADFFTEMDAYLACMGF